MSTAYSVPPPFTSASLVEGIATLSKRITAIPLLPQEEGQMKFGPVRQLEPGTVHICGLGYDERTVQIRRGQSYYVVFREDLNFPEYPSSFFGSCYLPK